jgi:hypothetical protein
LENGDAVVAARRSSGLRWRPLSQAERRGLAPRDPPADDGQKRLALQGGSLLARGGMPGSGCRPREASGLACSSLAIVLLLICGKTPTAYEAQGSKPMVIKGPVMSCVQDPVALFTALGHRAQDEGTKSLSRKATR